MRFGYCANMNATGADGTGIEFVEKLAELGFDYIELPLAEMAALSDKAFRSIVRRVEASGIRCETCNNFFPKTLRLTGSGTEQNVIAGYVEKALGRASALGAEYVVFGSGPAKNVPEGFSMEEGYRQVVQLLQMVSLVAEKNGVTVVIEPLRKQECNLINSFAEGCALAKDVGRDNVKVLVDFYHLSQEREPLQNLLDNGHQYLRHLHIARNEGRSFPQEISENPYKPFAEALKAVGYDRRISLEAYTPDFDAQAPGVLRLFRALF